MKSLIFILVSLISVTVYSQPPEGFNYQAIYRDAQGNPVASTAVSVVFSILDSIANGSTLYQETHNTTTNTFGLFTLTVGGGTPNAGSFSGINWGKNNKFLKVNINNILQGTTQLLSVPYALYAGNGSLWKDTSVVIDGITYKYILSRIGATVSTAPFDYGTRIKDGYIELWAPYPYIDFKNDFVIDADMRIAYDNSNGGYLTISTYQTAAPNWKWDQFVFNKSGNMGIGTSNPKAKLNVSGGDIYIQDISKGVIMKSPNGQCWRMTVSNAGVGVYTYITCP
jgi:hypothetical protein